MSNNFLSLILRGENLGLAANAQGTYLLTRLQVEDVVPLDVEKIADIMAGAGVTETQYIYLYDFGTHVQAAASWTSQVTPIFDYNDLHRFLRSTLLTFEDKHDEVIGDIREQGLREVDPVAAGVEPDEVEEEYQEDSDEVEGDDLDEDGDIDTITVEEPSGKPTSAKYKKALKEMAEQLASVFSDALDADTWLEVLPTLFEENQGVVEFEGDVDIFEQLASLGIEFEESDED